MGLPWFRLYTELKDDPKVWKLTDSQFRVYIEALCWAAQTNKNGSLGMTLEETDHAFRRAVTSTVTCLFQAGLLCINSEGEISVTHWSKRQYQSDSSTDRVRRYRERRKRNRDVSANVTVKRDGNGQTRTDQNRPEQTPPLPPSTPPVNPPPNNQHASGANRRKPSSLQECSAMGQRIGMSDSDAQSWFRDMEASNWSKVDGTPFANWPREMAMARDRLRERRAIAPTAQTTRPVGEEWKDAL